MSAPLPAVALVGQVTLTDQVEYELLADGTIAITPADPQRGRAWRAP